LTVLKTVSCRPILGWSAELGCAGLQFLLEELRHMRSDIVREGKLLHSGPAVVIRRHSATWFVWISTQETKDGAPESSRIASKVIKEINAKLLWVDIPFPSRDDRTRIGTQEHSSSGQIPIDFVDVGRVKRFDLAVMHFHRQVRPHSLNRITRQKDHL